MTHPLSLEELADQADVDVGFVRRLQDLGALGDGDDAHPYSAVEVRLVRLLHAWDRAGLSADAVMQVVRAGALSFGFLETPAMALPERLDRTYGQFAEEQGVSLELLQRLSEAIGFAAPGAEDRIREDEPVMVGLLRALLVAGVPEAAALGMFRVHAEGVRRAAKAEADLYEAHVEERLRRAGTSERELLARGADAADRLLPLLERTLLALYLRHRGHVWIEHSLGHAETELEKAGLYERVARPHAICFVDLTGYTRLTEERGDAVAARLAAELASLVDGISGRHGGRAIRWLGDGGLFHFKDPTAAVLAGLEMVEAGAGDDLPPRHVGVHAGPVVFQDGDVYGRTVNMAARISGVASAGQVLVSGDTVEVVAHPDVSFEPVGSTTLKGVSEPVVLHRALRRGA